MRFHELANGVELQVQVQPVLANQRSSPQHLILQDTWQHLIQTEVPAAGWTVLLAEQEATELSHRNFAKLTFYGSHARDSKEYLSVRTKVYPEEKIAVLEPNQQEELSVRMSTDMEIRVDASLGLLKAVKWSSADDSAREVRQSLLHYKTRGSGAYIFDPTGPASVMADRTTGMVAVEGPLQAGKGKERGEERERVRR